MGLRQDKRSRDRQGAVSPPQESGPATSLRPTQGDQNRRVFDGAVKSEIGATSIWPVTGVPGSVSYSRVPLRRAKLSRERKRAAMGLRSTQGDENRWVFDGAAMGGPACCDRNGKIVIQTFAGQMLF